MQNRKKGRKRKEIVLKSTTVGKIEKTRWKYHVTSFENIPYKNQYGYHQIELLRLFLKDLFNMGNVCRLLKKYATKLCKFIEKFAESCFYSSLVIELQMKNKSMTNHFVQILLICLIKILQYFPRKEIFNIRGK